MTLLVVGVSHRTAPVALLDRLALVDADAQRLQVELLASPHVAESLVLSTCNRVELYAEVSKFHGAVVDATETLAKATGVDRDELTPHLYVRYDERAVQHLFEVAAGLDSMVVGEQQILGQVREIRPRTRKACQVKVPNVHLLSCLSSQCLCNLQPQVIKFPSKFEISSNRLVLILHAT